MRTNKDKTFTTEDGLTTFTIKKGSLVRPATNLPPETPIKYWLDECQEGDTGSQKCIKERHLRKHPGVEGNMRILGCGFLAEEVSPTPVDDAYMEFDLALTTMKAMFEKMTKRDKAEMLSHIETWSEDITEYLYEQVDGQD